MPLIYNHPITAKTQAGGAWEQDINPIAWNHQITAQGVKASGSITAGTLGIEVRAPGGDWETLKDSGGTAITASLVPASRRGIQFTGHYDAVRITPTGFDGDTYNVQLMGSM